MQQYAVEKSTKNLNNEQLKNKNTSYIEFWRTDRIQLNNFASRAPYIRNTPRWTWEAGGNTTNVRRYEWATRVKTTNDSH